MLTVVNANVKAQHTNDKLATDKREEREIERHEEQEKEREREKQKREIQ